MPWTRCSKGSTVLLVEDDPVLRSTLAYKPVARSFRVLTAADGEAGLDQARKAGSRLDLVVLDVMLPGMSGFQVLRILRTETDIPILMLSARGEEQDRIDGLELGADDYVVKPFALRELMARVRAGVRRRAVRLRLNPRRCCTADRCTSRSIVVGSWSTRSRWRCGPRNTDYC